MDVFAKMGAVANAALMMISTFPRNFSRPFLKMLVVVFTRE
jgi:hypothetical protein